MAINEQDFMIKSLSEGIEKYVQEFVQKEMSRICREFEDRLRKELPNIAVALHNMYDVTRNGNTLTVSIKIEKETKQ